MLKNRVQSRRGPFKPDAESSGSDRPRTTVLLADDHEVVRQGIHAMLESEHDLLIVGDAADGHEAVEMAMARHPDVVVIDDSMPHLNGIEATRRILKIAPTTRVVVLSTNDDDEHVERATTVGAAGYVSKVSSIKSLLAAIRTVRTGKSYFNSSDSCEQHHRVRLTPSVSGGPPCPFGLTEREAEVLQRIAESRSNNQIAKELGISIKTVEKHRQKVMKKLDIHDVAGLTRHALASGIVECCVGHSSF